MFLLDTFLIFALVLTIEVALFAYGVQTGRFDAWFAQRERNARMRRTQTRRAARHATYARGRA